MTRAANLVHIVDDDAAVRASTALLLSVAGYHTAEHPSGDRFLASVARGDPGIVLLDLRMPGLDGLSVMRAMREEGLDWPVIIITAHGEVAAAVTAMKQGAIDFLEKPYAREHLLAAVAAASRHRSLSGSAGGDADARARVAALSPREREVLARLLAGLPNKRIAYALGISPRTVEIHRAHMMNKLGAQSFSHAIRLGIAAGLTAPADRT